MRSSTIGHLFVPSLAPAAPNTRRLWLLGIGMLPIAGYFAVRYPLPGNSGQLRDIGNMSGYSYNSLIGYAAGMIILFVLYCLALRECRRLPGNMALRPVFGCGAALAAIFAFMYPTNAIDVFIYAVRSRLLTHYGENPNAAFPADHWDDPYMHFGMKEWSDDTSPYGPLWNLVAAPITAIGGDRIGWALAGFKTLAVMGVLVGGWAIARTITHLRPNAPGDAAVGALFWLWNPLVLWEGVGNAHNDVLLTVTMLLALLAWATRRWWLVVPTLVAGALLKYLSVIVLPLVAIALFRRLGKWPMRWRIAVESAILSVILVLIAFYPFYNLSAVRASLTAQSTHYLTSPAGITLGYLSDDFGGDVVRQWVRLAGAAALLLVLGWWGATVWERSDRLPRGAFEAMFFYLLIASASFRSWYVIWPLGLAALLPWGWPFARMVVWSATALAGYVIFIWGGLWWGSDRWTMDRWAVLLMFVPVVAVTVAEWVTAMRGATRQSESVVTPRRLGEADGAG